MSEENCQHQDFAADVRVNRLEDSGRFVFMADVRIKCVQCNQDFVFRGLPMGVNLSGAATSFDGTEARMAICPPEDFNLYGIYTNPTLKSPTRPVGFTVGYSVTRISEAENEDPQI